MESLIVFIIAFILGFVAGAIVIFKKKTKVPRDIESSLRSAVVIPGPAKVYSPAPAESESRQKTIAENLEKRMLYEEELALIFKMGREMFSNVSVESIARLIVETATSITGAEISVLLLKDKEGGDFLPAFSKGVKPEFLDNLRIKKGESISGWVIENREPLVKYDIENDRWVKDQNRGEYFVNSLVSIPLVVKDGTIGVLNLSNKHNGQRFSEDEIAFLKGLTAQASLALQNANLYEQVQENYLRTITALAFALDARDSYTRQHSENVTRYAVAIAQEMKLRSFEIDRIKRAGLLHDIGKIGIRDGVLLKPTKLTEEEYKDIKNHPSKGETIVSALPFLKEEAKIIRHHHERFDGAGYPDGLAGDKIELGARILAVADSFDAMVENRVYRKALDLKTIFTELKNNSGKQFDPQVAETLIKIIEKNPGFLNKQSQNP